MDQGSETPRQKINAFAGQFWKKIQRGQHLPKIMIKKESDRDFEDVLEIGESCFMKRRSLENSASAKSYTRLIAILGVIAELLGTGRTMSQRDVYYTLKFLFKNQSECNLSIIELGQILNLKRHEMGIVPASRGYIAGSMTFQSDGGPVTDCSLFTSSGGLPVSAVWTSCPEENLHIQSSALYMFVIEKEGIFKHLCETAFHEKLPSILVTGCGFPDIATRALVARVSRRFPHIKVFGLCDYNPYGLALLLTFKLGSRAKAFEGSEWKCPTLRWLGLHCHQASSLGLGVHASEPMSERDVRVAVGMLNMNSMQRQEMQGFSKELEQMLEGGRKYELETVYSRGLDFFPVFLERAIANGDFL